MTPSPQPQAIGRLHREATLSGCPSSKTPQEGSRRKKRTSLQRASTGRDRPFMGNSRSNGLKTSRSTRFICNPQRDGRRISQSIRAATKIRTLRSTSSQTRTAGKASNGSSDGLGRCTRPPEPGGRSRWIKDAERDWAAMQTASQRSGRQGADRMSSLWPHAGNAPHLGRVKGRLRASDGV